MRSLLFAFLLAAPSVARAEDPCRSEGARVSCTKEGFDVLINKFLDARKEAEQCSLELERRVSAMAVLDAKARLAQSERDEARAQLEVLKTKPFPAGDMFTAAGLAALSGVAAASVPHVSSDLLVIGLAGTAVTSAIVSALIILSE